MRVGIMRLSAKQVEKLRTPGRHPDGDGLYLQITPTGVKSWVLRYERNGRERMLGLGTLRDFSLKEARERARRARQQLADGIDPIDARRAERAVPTITFREAAQAYNSLHEAKWRNPRHRAQFLKSLSRYAFPILGNLLVAAVDTPVVLRVVQPIWNSRTETASRVRGRIEAVLDWATVSGHRKGDNPARWKGHLDQVLPAPSAVTKVQHHPALPWSEISSFMVELRGREGVAARALEFAILTAMRTSEVLGARWSEMDLPAKVWTVPAERMKATRPHRVPLPEQAVELLRGLFTEADNDYVFIGAQAGKSLARRALAEALGRMNRSDITVHGFRSTFRDWAAEVSHFPNHVVEQALAHTISNAVEAAYRRGDLFEKRRALMAEWAAFCTRSADGAVVPIRRVVP
jgi:integrase